MDSRQDSQSDALPSANKEEGLRARKRRATRAAIERAAISLVEELGYDHVTSVMIAERANVSPGTFFNYFPTKDAAIVGVGSLDLDRSAVFDALDRYMPCSLYHAVLSLFLQVVGSFDWESDVAASRMRLVTETPQLMRLFLDNTFGFVMDFRTIAAAYLRDHPERRACADMLTEQEEANLVVANALEAAKFALYRATSDPTAGMMTADEVEAVVRRVMR